VSTSDLRRAVWSSGEFREGDGEPPKAHLWCIGSTRPVTRARNAPRA